MYNYSFNENDLFAVYLRKSQADDPNEPIEITLSKHKSRLQEVIKRYNIKDDQVSYYEEVVSGDTIANRPKMQELLNNVNVRKYRGVFVVALDRLSRGDAIDQGIVNNSFYYSNTLIITPDKIYDIANNDADREQLEFGLFISKREYNIIKKRMYLGKVESAKQGYYPFTDAPFGYDKQRIKAQKGILLVPNENAYYVQKIFNDTLNGKKASIIANELNVLGIKTVKDKDWRADTVRLVLRNEVYYGAIKFGKAKTIKQMNNGTIEKKVIINKKYDLYQGKHEPIISKEIFNKVQDTLDERKSYLKLPTSNKLSNPLSGLVYCKYCLDNGEKRMMRKVTCSRTKKDGTKYERNPFLFCLNKNCNNHSSELNLVENKIIDSLKKILKDYQKFLKDYEIKKIIESNTNEIEIKKINTEINKINSAFDKAKDFYELGDYSREEYLERKEKYTIKLESLNLLKEELLKNDAKQKVIEIKKRIPILEKCVNDYYFLSVEEQNKLLKSIIKRVIYYKPEAGRWLPKDNFELSIELLIDVSN